MPTFAVSITGQFTVTYHVNAATADEAMCADVDLNDIVHDTAGGGIGVSNSNSQCVSVMLDSYDYGNVDAEKVDDRDDDDVDAVVSGDNGEE